MSSQGSLKSQPGEKINRPKSYYLPGEWARLQLDGRSYENTHKRSLPRSDLQKALASEAERHVYWEQWQGVTPGVPIYEDPREKLDTLGPNAKYGTEGRV